MSRDGVFEYEVATVDIFFEKGKVACCYCPLLETYARNQCRRTGEYLIETKVTVGWQCPLIFNEKEKTEK